MMEYFNTTSRKVKNIKYRTGAEVNLRESPYRNK